jgi:hypothetical protein
MADDGCSAFIRGGRWPCSRYAAVFRVVKKGRARKGFCKQHDPVAVKKRDEARRTAESSARSRTWERRELEERAFEMLSNLDADAADDIGLGEVWHAIQKHLKKEE